MELLIVDDDAISRKIMKAVCQRLGYKVTTANNGVEAWHTFDRDPFRIIMCDWVMPEMDGIELCYKVRNRPDTDYTFFFLITGKKTSLGNYSKAMEAGVDDFIYKPVDADVFRNQLRVAERVLGLINKPIESLEEAA